MDEIEREARVYAARVMMHLDSDGEHLPDDLWQQAIPYVTGARHSRECPVCGGDGGSGVFYVEEQPATFDDPGWRESGEYPCSFCHGSGQIEDDLGEDAS